jgi:hypothetical protein
VTYLNERRDLWTAAYPEVNIWGRAMGKLVLTEADAHERQSQRLRTIFYYQTLKTNRPVLVEKLPINNFRIRFLNAIFPDAIYIHILRNGVEVAKSIQRKATWYSKHDYRWQQLLNYALSNPITAALPALCDDDYDRGLLEWRLSLDALYTDLPKLNESRFLQITYQDMVNTPESILGSIVNFIGLPASRVVTEFAVTNIERKHAEASKSRISEKERILGGKYLDLWS